MTPEDRARKSAEIMWSDDAASKWFGFELTEVSEGRAVLTLAVQPHHCNGHGTCHGGVTFALADSAFAFACNSRNQATVAQHCVVSFIAPVGAGDTLRAEAKEVSMQGRSGIYDVRVTMGDAPVAEFRGFSRTIPGQHFEEGA